VELYSDRGKTEDLGEKPVPGPLSTTNPTWIDPGANPCLRDERPATNHLSHDTAIEQLLASQGLCALCGVGS
jgi:hypothetical protein